MHQTVTIALVTFTVTGFSHAPALEGLHLGGASHGEVSGFEGESMTFKASGASSITGTLTAKDLTLDLSGASRAALEGSADALHLALSGASRADAVRFAAKSVTVDLSGASSAQLDVGESLKGDLSGASHVTYKLRPTVVDVSTSGASRVEQMEPEELEFMEDDEWN